MAWVVPWSRYLDWLKPGDVGKEDHLINGLTCTAEIRSLAISCPACGAAYEIRGQRQAVARLRPSPTAVSMQSGCRFAAPVHVIVDVGARPYEPKRAAAAQ